MHCFCFSFFVTILSRNDFICVRAVLVNYPEFGVIKMRILDSLPNSQIFQRVFIGYPNAGCSYKSSMALAFMISPLILSV